MDSWYKRPGVQFNLKYRNIFFGNNDKGKYKYVVELLNKYPGHVKREGMHLLYCLHCISCGCFDWLPFIGL